MGTKWLIQGYPGIKSVAECDSGRVSCKYFTLQQAASEGWASPAPTLGSWATLFPGQL